MPSICAPWIGGSHARITKLDACGLPLTGVGSCQITTTGFTSIERTPEMADPDEFFVRDAGGRICIDERTAPLVRWYNLVITFCSVDPDVINLLTGNPLVLNDASPTPSSVGWRTRKGANVNANVGIEIWSKIGGQACSGGTTTYGYALHPFVTEGVIGDVTWENGPVSFQVTGARARANSLWGVGPYNVLNKLTAPLGPAPLLSAITADDLDHIQYTTLAPPAPTCGCTTVPAP